MEPKNRFRIPPAYVAWRAGTITPKKIYRLKEDQAFSLSLELGQREKVVRHPSADFLLQSKGGGGDFVDMLLR